MKLNLFFCMLIFYYSSLFWSRFWRWLVFVANYALRFILNFNLPFTCTWEWKFNFSLLKVSSLSFKKIKFWIFIYMIRSAAGKTSTTSVVISGITLSWCFRCSCDIFFLGIVLNADCVETLLTCFFSRLFLFISWFFTFNSDHCGLIMTNIIGYEIVAKCY